MRMYKREFNVYRVVNDMDDMVYIGSTTTELWHRMSQHRADAKKGAKSPLYDLMREHGIDHFWIERVMTSDADSLKRDEEETIRRVPEERRLNFKRSCQRDTSAHYDYDEICRVYGEVHSQNKTANIIGCSTMTVKKALRSRGVKISYPPHTAHKYTEQSA